MALHLLSTLTTSFFSQPAGRKQSAQQILPVHREADNGLPACHFSYVRLRPRPGYRSAPQRSVADALARA